MRVPSGGDIGRLESLYPYDRSVLVCMNTFCHVNNYNDINAIFNHTNFLRFSSITGKEIFGCRSFCQKIITPKERLFRLSRYQKQMILNSYVLSFERRQLLSFLIGHFRFPLCLCFKVSLSAKPFL